MPPRVDTNAAFVVDIHKMEPPEFRSECILCEQYIDQDYTYYMIGNVYVCQECTPKVDTLMHEMGVRTRYI